MLVYSKLVKLLTTNQWIHVMISLLAVISLLAQDENISWVSTLFFISYLAVVFSYEFSCHLHRRVYKDTMLLTTVTHTTTNGVITEIITARCNQKEYPKGKVRLVNYIGVKHYSGVLLMIPTDKYMHFPIIFHQHYYFDAHAFPFEYVYTDNDSNLVYTNRYLEM